MRIGTLIKEEITKFINENVSKEEFYKRNNINPEELNHLGRGEYGDAYEIDNNRVLKVTTSKSEFDLATQIKEKGNVPALDSIANIYDTAIVDGDMMIVMENLEMDSDVEDKFYELQEILSNEGLPVQYVHYLDTDDFDLDDDMINFINSIEDINRAYRYLGIEASDIQPDNLGYDKNGNLKAFDIDDKNS